MKRNILIAIIVVITLSLTAYDESYIVKQDGTGDFSNIHSAINAVANGTSAIIYVFGSATPYTGTNNTDLTWNGNDKSIYMCGVNNPQIDCNDNSRAFSLSYTTLEDIIEGFTIVDASGGGGAGGAIRVKDGCTKIKNNTFEDCHYGTYTSSYQMNDYTNSRGGAIFIEHANDDQSSEISGNSFDNCVAFEGGAICVEEGYCLIENNEFDDNHACYSTLGTGNNGTGGAIHLISSITDVLNNEFTSNSAPAGELVISSYLGLVSEVTDNIFDSNYRGNWAGLGAMGSLVYCSKFNNNIVKNHAIQDLHLFYLLLGYTNPINTICRNNTFIDNEVQLAYSADQVYTNCIFKNNSSPYTGSNFINDEELEYCSIYNSESIANATLTNCITVDPKISSTTYQPLWNSTTKSPCIDTGDPSITDPDETPSDMGAVRAIDHDYHITTATPNRYRYRSFPVLDRTYGEGFTTTYVCQPVEDQTEYFEIFNIDPSYTIWSSQIWLPTELGILNSKDGYKLYTDDEVDIPTSGITLPENTEIDLNSGENWIGYFVKESMTIDEAFADIWDHLEAVYSEDWAWQHGGVIQPERCALIYGKMYIVYVDAACSFVYGDGPSVPPEEREMTDGFTYSETPAYTPINITELDDPTVEEVGVLLDGACIGATKVEDFPLQILAFPPNTSRGSGNLTFAFYYGNRSYEYSEKYFIVDPNTGQTSQSTIELRPYHFNTISFGKPPKRSQTPKIITSNYPNPFNPSSAGRSPSTTISYSLPQETDMLTLEIYNIKGQKVKTLLKGEHDAGTYQAIWSGKDDNGTKAAAGIYFYKLSTPEHTLMKKMMLLK